MGRSFAAGIFVIAVIGFSHAQDASERTGIVNQHDYRASKNACGPAALLNLLKFSNEDYTRLYYTMRGATDAERLGFVIDKYFRNRKSTVEPKWSRWGAHGIFAEDLATGINEWLIEEEMPELRSEFLTKKTGETEGGHMRRIHEWIARSIEQGVTPILSLRSYIVRTRKPEEPRWEAGIHHYVVVVEVDESPGDLGFHLVVLDSAGGKEVGLFLHRDGGRLPFVALQGSGDKSEWVKGFPYLQVMAPEVPSLRPKNLKWSERYLVTANLLIGDF